MKYRYTYRVTWSPEDGEHMGLCAKFRFLVGVHVNHRVRTALATVTRLGVSC